jgi:hypothetical protein
MSTMAAAPADTLLDDRAVVDFIIRGHLLLELDLPAGVNERIAATLDGMEGNPGDAITDAVPELHLVLDHPLVQGALTSLAGEDYEVMAHRHWHCKEPGTAYMHWHQDGKNRRGVGLDRFLGLYYPADVTAAMGPTIIVPGTHFRNAPTDRMRTYTNIRGQVPLVVKGGTFALTHYDLWHGTAANRSGKRRHMIKFLFARTGDNEGATWKHDPQCMNRLRDWNLRDQAQDPFNQLSFANPLNVSQSDSYKERAIRREIWAQLTGEPLR